MLKICFKNVKKPDLAFLFKPEKWKGYDLHHADCSITMAMYILSGMLEWPSLSHLIAMQGGGGGGGGDLYDGDAHVLPLTSTNFPTSKDQSVYLVEFYAPWWVFLHTHPPDYNHVDIQVGILRDSWISVVSCMYVVLFISIV